MQLVVVGGGTGTNAIAPIFDQAELEVTYVVPISDNGGSTSEVLRLFGGPAIGDARSRLVRLIEPSPLKDLLALRLSDDAEVAAKDWNRIVDGTHSIWANIAPYMKAMYRAFLVNVHAELLKRTTTSRPFDFRRASIGNLILTGTRLFFGTLDAAIEFILHTTRVPRHYSVVPCMNTNFIHHIAAQLEDNTIVVGQSAISHPSLEAASIHNSHAAGEEDPNDSYPHPSLRHSHITFAKSETPSLPSAVKRVYYVNIYGDEIRRSASQRVITKLQSSDAVVFSVGSLYTSIIPVLLLQGLAESLPKTCVLILNGSEDRETEGMSPLDYMNAINSALTYSRGREYYPEMSFVTSVIYPSDLDISEIKKVHNITCEPAICVRGEYDIDSLEAAVNKCLANGSSI